MVDPTRRILNYLCYDGFLHTLKWVDIRAVDVYAATFKKSPLLYVVDCVLGDRALSYARVANNSEQPFFLVVAEKVFD